MTFIAIIASLLLGRAIDASRSLRSLDTLNKGVQRGLDRARDNIYLGISILLAAMLGPAVLAHFLAQIFDGALFGLLALAWSIAVLWVCLSPLSLETELDAYLQAAEVGDTETLDDCARRLSGVDEFTDGSARHKVVIRTVLIHLNTRIVSVLFWFAVLGPFGAVLYRTALHLIDQPVAGLRAKAELMQRMTAFVGVLTWLPTRLTWVAYALAGKFEGTLTNFLRAISPGGEASLFEDNNTALSDAGVNALALQPGQPVSIEAVYATRRLAVRALVVCLVAVAILSCI